MKLFKCALLTAAVIGATSCSDSGDNSPSLANDNPTVSEVTLLGSDWRYEGWHSPCPDQRAIFENTQFLSTDGVNIHALSRDNGNLIDVLTCNSVEFEHLVLSVAAANATDPADATEIRAMVSAGLAFHYAIPESSIDVIDITLTQNEISYSATLSGFGYSMTEHSTITRLP